MEKFGIFELLDALSAMTQDAPREPDPNDKAFEAPSFPSVEGVPREELQESAGRDKPPKKKSGAIEGFYARHAAVAKKAKEKND